MHHSLISSVQEQKLLLHMLIIILQIYYYNNIIIIFMDYQHLSSKIPFQQNSNKQTNKFQKPQKLPLSSNMMQEISIFQNLIEKNNQLVSFLEEKYDVISQKFQEIEKSLQMNQVKNEKQPHEQKDSFEIEEEVSNGKLNSIQTEKLQIQLFGIKEYKYRLVFEQRFSRTLYKDRNFSFKLALVDNVGKKVKNSYFIPIALSAYNSNNIPQIILENKKGQPIFKGNYQTQLVKGQATFDKIQFRQVTSVYHKHWIYFVIYPKASPFKYKPEGEINQIDIDYSEICPLLVNEILVKSKKMI